MLRQLYPVEHQNPLNSARTLLENLWHAAEFEAAYMPYWKEAARVPEAQLLRQPEQLVNADPFAPVMPCNHAPAVLQTLRADPQQRIGVFLRPCEWRSFQAIADKSGERFERLFSISADCTGVIPLDDFGRHAAQDPHQITREVLHFATLGGILPSRYQASCQLCEQPFPEGVDLHIELFGIPTDQQLMLVFKDAEIARALSRRTLVSEAAPSPSGRREQVIQDLARWRTKSFEKRKEQLGPELLSLAGLASHLRSCEDCRSALNLHCPLIELELLTDPLGPELEELRAWLQSCSGCGVCEQNCPQGYPLFSVIFSLRAGR